jgi:hypothetical protein
MLPMLLLLLSFVGTVIVVDEGVGGDDYDDFAVGGVTLICIHCSLPLLSSRWFNCSTFTFDYFMKRAICSYYSHYNVCMLYFNTYMPSTNLILLLFVVF